MAGNLGFHVSVAAEAVATHERKTFDGRVIPAQQVHEVSLASLHDEFATVLDQRRILTLLEPS